jgi:hypothetical protein
MIRKLKVYLETSIFNFVFADDAPDKQEDTLALFREIVEGKYAAFTSEYVIMELQKAPEPKRGDMLSLIKKHGIEYLPGNEETEYLAGMYVREGIVPAKYSTDALHIAAATVNDMDLIVSYNFKHIVKLKTATLTEVVNLREGYRKIGIFSPTEVIENVD